ncbi:hypothetical protein LX81_01309 [Palleronia aestuarii]|uniref:Secreted protein n=1 Tax=Palleronia aestuarii TaxID=568105 RepID=A0A2W7NLN9_9RHOB|nr:DUF1223 domain-containing protein [Palleronia aestuarii]PZX17584.1 hypothetical protein LX81_01309 [Palleronia aestuarii]
MRAAVIAVFLGLVPFAGAFAGTTEQPVVVELYTSQGCSACPEADAMIADLADHEGVLPLALHIDYWDYIGWVDIFADPDFTKRQKAYARVAGSRTIFTPQMIVSGTDHVVGAKPVQLMDLIQKHAERPDPVSIDLARKGGSLVIDAVATDPLEKETVVQLVRYSPAERVEITRGENAGLTIDYANVVREWRTLGAWDGQAPLHLEVAAEGPVAVIVQYEGFGQIVAAASLE